MAVISSKNISCIYFKLSQTYIITIGGDITYAIYNNKFMKGIYYAVQSVLG